jgi:hypothetical protein
MIGRDEESGAIGLFKLAVSMDISLWYLQGSNL